MPADQVISLVKYCSAATSLKVLNSQSLRWNAPSLHSDPFEPDHLSSIGFTLEMLQKEMIKEAIGMLFGPSDPSGKSNRLIAAICRWRDEDRFASEEEAEQVLTQLLGQVALQQQELIDSYMEEWREFSRTLRICSFADKPNNIHCWQRYADNHAGIALRFSTGEGTSLPNPQRVTYGITPPLVTSLKEQIAVIYGRQNLPSSAGFMEKLLSKNKSNNVEREWRCFSHAPDNATEDDLLHNYQEFSPNELKGVYLGLTTSYQDKEAVIQLVKDKYPKTRVYQAEAVSGRYELDFVQLGIR